MKKVGISLLILMSFCFISCFSRGPVDQEAAEEYVKNLTEEDIVTKNSSAKLSYMKRSFGNKVKLSVKRFSGVEEILAIKATSEGKKLKVTSKIEQGAIRIVLCDSKNIIYEFKVGEEDSFEIPVSSGKLYLKAAGKDANYSLEYEYERGIDEKGSDGYKIIPKRDEDLQKFSI